MTEAITRNGVLEIDPSGLREGGFRGQLIAPHDPDFDSARKVWNGMIDRRPGLIARCRGTSDVVAAVNFARDNGLLVAVRGGGHSVAGYGTCDGGIVIDLSELRGVHVDPAARTVRVQGGATLGDVDNETQLFGLVTPTGNASTTGIAGLTLSGGLSHIRRKYGMSVDNLLSVQLVTADGSVVNASESENSDLFWGIRGGGGNFGIVTSFEFRLHPLGPMVMFPAVFYPFEMIHEVLRAWRDFTAAAPDEATSDAIIWRIPPAPMFPEAIHGKPFVGVAGMYAGDVDEGARVFQPLLELGEPLANLGGPMPFTAAQSAFDALFPAGDLRYYWKSLYLDDLSEPVIDAIVAEAVDRPSPQTFIPIRHLGGAISRVPDGETPVANRTAPYLLSIDNTWSDPADDRRNVEWTQRFWRRMQEFGGGGTYLNFAGLGEEGEELGRSAHGDSFERLVALKRKYDPENLFRLNQNIEPGKV